METLFDVLFTDKLRDGAWDVYLKGLWRVKSAYYHIYFKHGRPKRLRKARYKNQ